MFMSFHLKSGVAPCLANICAVVALTAVAAMQAEAQLPAVVPISASASYTTPAGVTIGGTPTKVARDAAGNIYIFDRVAPQVLEIPVSGPYQVVVPKTDASVSCGAYNCFMSVDQAGNIYISQTYSSNIVEIPRLANGAYNYSAEATALNGGNMGGLTGFYYNPGDIAFDSLGNAYIVSNGGNGGNTCCGGSASYTGKGIIMIGPSATSGKYLLGANGAPAHTPVSVVADGTGDLFYADGTSVYELTAASIAASPGTTPVPIQIGYNGTGTCTGCATITGPIGVTVDNAGNVYVNETSGGVLAIVNNGSAFSTTSATYAVASVETYSVGAIMAIDNQGNLIGVNSSNNVARLGGGSIYINNTFGASQTAISYPGAFGSPSLTYLFTASTTLNATTPVAIVNGGSVNGGSAASQLSVDSGATTCTAGTTYTAGQTCNVTFYVSNYEPGILSGSVVLYGSSGNVLNVTSGEGIVAGAAVTIDPGVQTTIGKSYVAPSGIAVDANGNTYVADASSNAVYEYAPGSTSAGTSIGSGLSAPAGVAVDAAGDVYIADTGNSRVVVVPNTLSGLSTASQTTVATTGFTLSGPHGVALDALGDLYIADTGDARVLKLANPLSGSVNAAPVTVGTGFTSPYGIAVDAVGDIYVADKGSNSVVLIPGGGFTGTGTTNTGSGVQTTVGTGFSAPTGVAVDASGSVYVADGGNARIVKIPSEAGVVTTAAQVTLSSGLSKPFGIATDQTSDLYFTDVSAPTVAFVQRSAANSGTASTISFGSLASGGTANQTITLSDAGYSTSLAVTAISTPTSAFTRGTAASNDCGATPTIIAGEGCNILLTFTAPGSAGTSNGSFGTTDNALGGTSVVQDVALTGVETSSTTITGAATLVYGTTPTYTATALTNGTFTVSITGTATSNASVTISGGTGTFVLPALGVGSYTLSLTAGGVTGTESISVTAAPLTLTVNAATRIFDQVNPAFTASYSGFKFTDTSSVVSGTAPTFSTTATRLSVAGNYSISLAGGTLSAANYSISLVGGTLVVTGSAPQAIFFPPLPNFTHGTSVTLTGVSTSGVPLTYAVTAGSATVSGSLLTITAAGTVTVQASQAGNGNYAAATPVTRSFTAQ